MDMSIEFVGSPTRGGKVARRKTSACLHSAYELLREHNDWSADHTRRVSDATSRERAEFVLRLVGQLHEDGYHIKSLHHLKPKHVRVIVRGWEKRGFAAAVLQKYFCFLTTLCRWIGKPTLAGKLNDHLEDVNRGKRLRHAVTDNSWSARTDTWQKMAEVMADDRRVALMLFLMSEFALRAREAWLFQPHNAVDYVRGILHIRRGTKGGRKRELNLREDWFDQPQKHMLIERTKEYATPPDGTLIPTHMSMLAWQSRFYRVLRRHGISRAKEIVAHGLRHQAANDLFEALTGRASPVRGGEPPNTPEEKATERAARLRIAEILGHGRIQVTASYYGTIRPKNSDSTDTALMRKQKLLNELATGKTPASLQDVRTPNEQQRR